jgi:hypothetical protein
MSSSGCWVVVGLGPCVRLSLVARGSFRNSLRFERVIFLLVRGPLMTVPDSSPRAFARVVISLT